MANIISIVTGLTAAAPAGAAAVTVTTSTKSISAAGSGMHQTIQSIGTTTSQSLTFTGITTPGYVLVKNLDPTSVICVSSETPAASGGSHPALITLKPGETNIISTRLANVYAITYGAGAANLLVAAAEV